MEQEPTAPQPPLQPHPLDRPVTAAHVVEIVRECLLATGLCNSVNRGPVDEIYARLAADLDGGPPAR